MTTDSLPTTADAQAREMARFGVTYDGRRYCCGEHRFDHLEDALAYALELRRAS